MLSLLILLVAAIALSAQGDDTFVPVYHPSLDVTPARGSIDIDGRLDDPGWVGAARADNFAEHSPGDQTRPPVETVALMTYDHDNVYVAFICYDEPGAVRASLCERERLWRDDNVGFFFDTYGDATWAYTMNVNPYGVQADAMWTPTAQDAGFDLVWESSGMITDSGYQVEMAIPLAALRFPNAEEQNWRVDFWRNHPRDADRSYSWAAYDRSQACWPCQWGTVTGIKGVKPGRGIEFMPTWVGYQAGSLSGYGLPEAPFDYENDDPRGELSFGGKYSFTSDITAEGTYNPDFSQIEADAGQIDVNSTFSLFYPERRPFFQEGSDIFRTLFNSFYTRTINNPEFAAKFTARTRRTDIGYLVARDENTIIVLPFEEFDQLITTGKSTSNILRVRHSIGRGSHVGFIATDRHLDDGGSGTVLSQDGLLRFSRSWSLSYQAVAAYTDEPDDTLLTPASWTTYNFKFWKDHTAAYDGESYWGTGGTAVLRWNTETWGAVMNYWQVSPTYRADNGYDPKNNRRDLTFSLEYDYRPNSELLDMISPSLTTNEVWNFDGQQKQRSVAANLWTQLKVAQIQGFFQYMRKAESYRGVQFDDIWNLYFEGSTRPSDLFTLGASAGYGHTIARSFITMGKSLSLGGYAVLKPQERIEIIQNVDYTRSNCLECENNDRLYNQLISRTRLGLQVTRQLSVRLVVQYQDTYELGLDPYSSDVWSIDPLITFRINPFSTFYVGSTNTYAEGDMVQFDDGTWSSIDSRRLTSRQYFMKLQYLFQI